MYFSCGGDAATFLSQAVDFCNQKVFGRLSCTILAHPKTDTVVVEKAVTDLQYGIICLNAWSAQAPSCPMASWGAFPGEPLDDVESGRGVVNNFLMYDHVEKTVLRTPFTAAHHIGTSGIPTINFARALVGFLTKPGLGTFLGFITADVPRWKLATAGAVAVAGIAMLISRFAL